MSTVAGVDAVTPARRIATSGGGPAGDILGRLAALAEAHPDRPALDDGVRPITFGALWSDILSSTGALRERLPDISDQTVAVLAVPGATLATAILAALASAHPLLVLDPDAPPTLLKHLVRQAGVRLVMTDRGSMSNAYLLFPRLDVAAADELRAPSPADLPPRRDAAPALLLPDHAAVPSLATIPRGALETTVSAVADRSGLAAADRVASLLGPWSEAGLIALLAALHCGATLTPIDLRHGGWAALPRRLRAGDIDALALTRPLERALQPRDLPSVRLLVIGAPDADPDEHDRAPDGHEPGGRSTVTLTTGLRAAALAPTPRGGHPPPRRTLPERAVDRVVSWDAGLVGRQFPLPVGPVPVDTIAWAPSLTDNWSTIRSELDELLDDGIELPAIDDVNGTPQGAEGPWSTYVLFAFGAWVAPNSARCPATSALVAAVPDLEIAGFTVLAPGTHIPGHRGPYRSLRYQLGVRIPGPDGACRLRVDDEVVVWRDGHALAFDDAVDHEAWNDADQPRYVFFVQTTWPVVGLAGRAHRVLHRALGRAAGDLAGRATALDRSLNGGG